MIWDESIAAAQKFGPLAGFIVAGHFYNLLSDSEHASQPPRLPGWQQSVKSRTAWLDEWIRANARHTLK